MTDKPKVRLAVVGTGLIGRVHAGRVASGPTTELTALCGLDEGASDLADGLAVPLVTDYRDILSLDPEGVVIATPNRLHVPMGRFFLEHHLPVLVEKPIADTVAGGLELCAAGSRTGLPILVGHHRRHNPLVATARELIASRIGTLIGFSILVTMRKPDSYYDPEWRRQAGAGPFLANLIHEVDLVRHMCGEIVAVQAAARQRHRTWAFDDTAAILLHLRNGAVGTVILSESTPSPWSWESTVSEGMDFHNAGQDHASFMGSEAALSFPSMTVFSYDPAEGEPGWRSPLHSHAVSTFTADPYKRQIEHFADVVRGHATPAVSGEDGLRSLAVVEAVVEAARTGSVVDVDSVTERASAGSGAS